MSRLTNKNVVLHKGRMAGKTIFNQIYDKLFKLEDLEESIGCPLEVVFKALKTNVWNDKTKRQEWVVLDYSNHEFVLKTTKELYIDDCKSILPLKDYGKTWWLKGEKVE